MATTPVELSPSKNRRSPANEARNVITSYSRSERHSVKRSSSGIGDTMPRKSLRGSIVAMSMIDRFCSMYMATAWLASWIATW